jgi:hypothetical protein
MVSAFQSYRNYCSRSRYLEPKENGSVFLGPDSLKALSSSVSSRGVSTPELGVSGSIVSCATSGRAS